MTNGPNGNMRNNYSAVMIITKTYKYIYIYAYVQIFVIIRYGAVWNDWKQSKPKQ